MSDGSEILQRRSNSRLWYRQPANANPMAQAKETSEQAAPVVTMTTEAAAETGDEYAYFEAADEYLYFDLDTTGMKLRTLDFDNPNVIRALRGEMPQPTPISAAVRPAWRTYPSTAPALLLSATENLGARIPGPVLNAGSRYRVVDTYYGVIAVEIDRLGLPPMRGYCTAVDLSSGMQCARPKRTSSQTAWLRSVSSKVSQALGVVEMPLHNAATPGRD